MSKAKFDALEEKTNSLMDQMMSQITRYLMFIKKNPPRGFIWGCFAFSVFVTVLPFRFDWLLSVVAIGVTILLSLRRKPGVNLVGWQEAWSVSLFLLIVISVLTFSLRGKGVITIGGPIIAVAFVLFYVRDRKIIKMQKEALKSAEESEDLEESEDKVE